MKEFKFLKNIKNLKGIKTELKKTSVKSNKSQDFNFFKPFIEKNKGEKKKYNFVIAAVILAAVFITSFVWNLIQVKNTQKEINRIKNIVESSDTKSKLNEMAKLNKKYDVLNKYFGQAYVVSGAIKNKDVIGSKLVGKICSALPKTLSFKTFSINVGEKGNGGSIQIQGTAETRVNTAELQHNLKSINEIKEVQVTNINDVDNVDTNNKSNGSSQYTFTIKCTLKDVDKNEVK